jgi:hypothetical protein
MTDAQRGHAAASSNAVQICSGVASMSTVFTSRTGALSIQVSSTLSHSWRRMACVYHDAVAAASYPERVELEVRGAVWYWRGPAPYHFITVPDAQCGQIEAAAPSVTYGWGMIPVSARVGDTDWKTSLFPKDGAYVVPLKTAVRRAEGIELGDLITIALRLAT